MANTITNLLPSLYAGLDIVSREMIGILPAIQNNVEMERAAVGQTVNVPVVGAATTGNITPGALPPDDGDQSFTTRQISITKAKYSPIRWNGEEQLALAPNGQQYNRLLADQAAQSMRALANEMEADAFLVAARNASRAYGTAGTTPFGTAGDLTDFAGANQILDENGAPMADRRFIINSASRFNLEGKQSVLFKVNESGGDAFLRRRVVGSVMGFDLGVSAQAPTMTKGTGSGYLVNNGPGYAVGATSIQVDTGTGTILAGDVVTFAGDPNKYVAAGLSGSTLTLNAPGLRQAAADNVAISVGNTYRANVAFTPNALVMAARPPAEPSISGIGDAAADRVMVQDPVSGLAFEVSIWPLYRQVRMEVALAWGFGAVKPEHIALDLG